MRDKMSKKPTIKSIAAELNVSFSTVSKALNDDPLITKETKARVLRKAKEMGYLPNPHALALRNKPTNTIGIILNDLENTSLAYVLKGISRTMSKHGYTTLISDSEYDPKVETRNIDSVVSRIPSAIILSSVTQSNHIKSLSSMKKQSNHSWPSKPEFRQSLHQCRLCAWRLLKRKTHA